MSIFLTSSRLKRIRRSDAAGIAWMVNREHYWCGEALQEILQRIRALCHEDANEAYAAGQSALEILRRRMIDPPPDLVGMALAVHGNTLRCLGKLDEALAVYEQALETRGLSSFGKSDILARMTVTLVCLNRLEEGFQAIEASLALEPDAPVSLAIRGWAYMVSGNLVACLRDSLAIISQSDLNSCAERPFLSAIVNATTVLSYELGGQVENSVLEQLQTAITLYRNSMPKGGSSFYKLQRLRHLLSRAQALLQARLGDPEKAIVTLRPVVKGLRKKFPDDALDASIDLMCLLAKMGEGRAAIQEARRALTLTDEATLQPMLSALNMLRDAVKKTSLSGLEAVELRIFLRSREAAGNWRQIRVA